MDDYAPLIERAFSIEPREQCYVIEEIAGEVPEFISGSYYLNGPARFSRAGLTYRHWLDGDGMVCSLRFESGRVRFTSRYVRSAKFVAEEDAGQPLFRTFGTTFDSDRLKRGVMLESPVNVSVYPYMETLLAFGEQGLPMELDPVTLETRGGFNFGGRLNDMTPFAAHPKFDRATGEMFNFGVSFSAEPHLNLYCFSEGNSLRYRERLRLEYACSIHDFSLSQNYAVFYLSPYILSMQSLTREGRTLMDSLSWEPERGSQLLIASRETGERVATIPIGERSCLHLINSFEEDDRLTVDVLEMDRPIYDQYQQIPDLFSDVCEIRAVRFLLDVKNSELIRTDEIDYRLAPDFPSIDPRRCMKPYRDLWMLGISATGRRGRKFFDQLVHASWETPKRPDVYHARPMQYLAGEPVFISDPHNEASGAVICQIFDAERLTSAFGIFDAHHVTDGPIATLRLKEPIHFGFHACFDSDFL